MLYKGPKTLVDSIAKVISEDRAKFTSERDTLEAKLQLEAMKKMKYEYVVPEDIEKEGVAHFIGAAAAAHKSGQKKFSFGGKTYPVQIKPHIAKKVNENTIVTESHFKVGDEVTCKASGMEGEVIKVDPSQTGKYYTVKRDDGKTVNYAPDELEAEKEDMKEASKEQETKFHTSLDKLVHKTFGKRPEEKMKKENTDTPGNSTHQCAVHVKHEQFGEGKTLFSQHAEPSEDGTIDWYDVMFEHGIEKQVKTSDLSIIVSESHGNHKKKMKEDIDLDEARGRPRKNPVKAKAKSDDDEDDFGPDTGPEPDQNIVNHLKKSVDTGGTHDVKFGDGSSHKVPSQVAHKVLGAMGKLKPADRLEIQKHINASHKNLMDVHRMIK